MTERSKISTATLVLGIVSIALCLPGAFVMILKQVQPSTLINTMIFWSIVALVCSLAALVGGCTGITLAFLERSQHRTRAISLNMIGIILAVIILLSI
jgi:hypothetical protein